MDLTLLQTVSPSVQASSGLTELKTISEIVKNFIEVAAVIGAVFALIKWLRERHDRALDVMLALEKSFTDPKLVETRPLIENDENYLAIVPVLTKCVLAALDPDATRSPRPTAKEYASLGSLDELLRFYVFLYGVRKARQVPDSALKASYRYWLTFYFHPGRTAFRAYVDWFYPTLSGWLRSDERREKSLFRKRFFTPQQYGWIGSEAEKSEQLRRGIDGRVLVLTGAGISADSKIPTFRGKEGHWQKQNPRRLATNMAFKEDPEQVWEWYQQRREKILNSKPNAAHSSLIQLEMNTKSFLLVTQNVDDLHERAVFDEKNLPAKALVHIHGRIFETRCSVCSHQINERSGKTRTHDKDADAAERIPRCPKCKGIMRPAVVWFDEDNDKNDEKRVEKFLTEKPCDVVLVIGTTARFDYIHRWALLAAAGCAWFVEINPVETKLSRFAHHILRERAKTALPRVVRHAVDRGPLYVG
jgi:NAD-dependent deacetylase